MEPRFHHDPVDPLHGSVDRDESPESTQLEDLESFNPMEPPPLDWRSDSSSEAGSLVELEICWAGHAEPPLALNDDTEEASATTQTCDTLYNKEEHDVEHSHIHSLLTQLHLLHPATSSSDDPAHCADSANRESAGRSVPEAGNPAHCADSANRESAGRSVPEALLFSREYQKDLLQLLEEPEAEEPGSAALVHTRHVTPERSSGDLDEMEDEHRWTSPEDLSGSSHNHLEVESVPAFKSVPGPCDPEDLLDGVVFGAQYLGSTQLRSERNPSTGARMAQAQEAVDRIKAPDGESQPMTEVDLFISTLRIKVLSADSQEPMMDHSLQMISYIADIGKIVVLMARRKPANHKPEEAAASSTAPPRKCWMICHVFSSEDAQTIAQAIGQAFGVAYQQFLYANGIKASDLRPGEYSDFLGAQELYNGDLVHFSRSENIREVCVTKKAGEILGVAIVESGWGSILPTVVVANLLHGGPAERSGELSIGDRIMSANGTSLVGLPITTCQSIIRDLKQLSMVKLSIVHCPPVTMAIIKRPAPSCQLGFSVEDGIICSLMRGGIAERGGIRVGHRIIEINGQSVVATPHDKIIHILSSAVGEIHLKTMPTSTYRLLTGLDQPMFL